ncbi:RagB/SusD family nutrient uptake outer membrane protein [Chryseobacterium sp. cx-311]|uniref:RagB/SusD family nutrient uptake outer membrane protein n=1 Tax=Marnyiella aurantia TaxID=2758037 RepID=UPI001AE76F03|nr:RagB/SusD family nutrient uptake outer membrane protein [Marnyiella aurantia]MBP0613953.1 RagB/SusD family nutrient uptake outer membrane protein [Marnyiella aurantia]
MKKQLFISVLCSMLLTPILSCEEVLDVDVPQNQMQAPLVFENTQTANAALAALYAGLYDNSPLAGDQTGRLLGIYTDELDFFAPTATNGTLELFLNVHADSNPSILTYWTNAYQKIYVANAIIEGVERSLALPAAERSRIKGEALLVRSILFYMLEEVFGDLPYPDSTDYTVNKNLGRTPAAQVLQRLEADLAAAEPLLGDTYLNAERIYPNRHVCRLMRAKVYLSQGRAPEAEILLKTIIQSPLYAFQNDLTKVFTKTGTHILWQLRPKNQGDGTKEALLYYFNNSAPSQSALSSSLMAELGTGDLRKQYWTAAVTAAGNTWYRADKYKNRTANSTEYSVIFRLEEVYLLLAESLMQQNKVAEALPYVNATRTRASLTPLQLPLSPDGLKTEILKEYRKEFFTERGIRFFSLKRMGRLNDLATIKPNWKPEHRLWPVPQKELLLNPNLKPQNPGY